MSTFLKLAGVTTWVIGAQLVNAGVAFATAEFRVRTGAIYSVPLTVALSTTEAGRVDQSMQESLSGTLPGYTPPNNGGPSRTGDSGSR